MQPLSFGRFRSRLRVSSLGRHLVLHSPLSAGPDAVFFGPDSYRFARFLEDNAAMLPAGARVVDLGGGAGAGALALASVRRDLKLVLVDINREAVRLARINLAAAGIEAEVIVEGQDALGQMLEGELSRGGYAVRYRELDPDIFGGMLWRPSYRGVDRIAAVTMIATRLG